MRLDIPYALIDMALKEDFGDCGDVTSQAIFGREETASFQLICKSDGILCGFPIFQAVFDRMDPKLVWEVYFREGDLVAKGDRVCAITGSVLTILQAERTALNFLSHLSGIATRTNEFVKAAPGKIRILDTRKTLPGFRTLQKYAVSLGGGLNHRMGLFDMVLIKDNHIDAAGSITSAVEKVRARWGDRFAIEVETRSLEEVREALACHVERIMLDNMGDAEMTAAIAIIQGRCEIEASGNMTRDRLISLNDMDIDYISFGELTNRVVPVDFSLIKI